MQGSLLVHDLRKVITLVDLLRDIGLDKQLSLPKVVVLGNQSSGKSSLLQQIVGLDFLPRGSGVVTRRPLELRMNNIPDLKSPYAQFDEILQSGKKKKFTDFNQVRKSIDEVTQKVCGKSKQIIDNPIVLNIFSNSCPNLTIVDLPGITSIPVGSQPKNIYEITKNMALRYVTEKRSIILCVIPANQDLSTSQALKILQEIDPSGQRSIGCLTKIDIMDRGVDAKKVLKNEQIPLRYGYVGIKNRSQEDINNNVPVSQSLKAEKKYFTTSPIYSTLNPETFGTQSLTHKLTSILYTQIKSSMPQIFDEIKKKKKQVQLELEKLGPGVASSDAQMVNYAWRSISDFLRIFKNSINGIKNVDYSKDPISSQIRRQLNELYQEEYDFPATENIKDRDIQKAIINFPGDSIPGFPSIDAFLALLTPLLNKLQQPAYTINNKIHEIMEQQCMQIIDSVMIKKFPDFNNRFIDLIKKVLDKYRKQLQSYLTFLLDSQLRQLYTNDISYLQGQFSLTEKDRKKIEKGQVKDPLLFELRKRIDSYFKLCVRNLRDLIPKQIFNFLIVKCLKEIEFESFQFTSDVNKLKQWLNQPGQVKNKRLQCQQAIKVFQESQKKIKMDPQISKLIKNSQKESKYYAKYGMKTPEQINEEKEKQMEKKRKEKIIENQKLRTTKNITDNSQNKTNDQPNNQDKKAQLNNLYGVPINNVNQPQPNKPNQPNLGGNISGNMGGNTTGNIGGNTSGNIGGNNIGNMGGNMGINYLGTTNNTNINNQKGVQQQSSNQNNINNSSNTSNTNNINNTIQKGNNQASLDFLGNTSVNTNTSNQAQKNYLNDFWGKPTTTTNNQSINTNQQGGISPLKKESKGNQQPKPPQPEKKKETFNKLFGVNKG